ncbi:MAG: tyrosine-type recombinase/integrase [Exiguobacterium chiriqhucha]|uniref:tyrosine-type recombinase/integrase n=1 Tax=Exiguobacterium chiriqhucha TaxID=1385984 RepID=UPI00144F2C14|nr:tyrosine-type recombinase/integrase [Exiguobacterium chiriqhucha]KAB2865287.1 MAG: tyrosine-type recombinase/integrase [Exiguobacterium chiriqhucha]
MEHMTINEAISIYLEDLEFRQSKSQDIVKTYRNTLRRFEKMMDESNVTLLKDVDETAHAYAYRDELVDCERAFNTIKKYVSVIKTFMAYSVHKGWITKNPFALVNVSGAEARRQSMILSREQLHRILYHADNATLYNIYMIGCDAGLRISETLNLTIEDVAFDTNELVIRHGKGNKMREVPMSDRLRDALLRYIECERPKTDTDSSYLFIMPRGTKVRANYVNEYLQKVSNEQLGFGITSHILRHSFATELHNAGVNITKISRLLGHASTETTELYLHISKEQNQETIEVLNQKNKQICLNKRN